MSARKVTAAALAATLAIASQTRAAELPLPKDGWASWDVQAVEDAPALCCWDSWDDRVANTHACDLDGERHGYGSRNHQTTTSMRI